MLAARELNAETAQRNQTLRAALEHHRAGRFDGAAALYQTLYAADKHDSEVVFLMGVLCCDLGLFDAASHLLEEALTVSPIFPEARLQWVIALNGQASHDISAGKLTQARLYLERVLEIVPDDGATLQGLGRIALIQGDVAAAENWLRKSAMQRPAHAETLNWLGLARLQLGHYATAETALRQALELQPDLIQARNNLGLVLHQQGRAEALACFEEALIHDPSYAKARINLAIALRERADLPAARDHLARVLAENPGDAEALNNLAVVYQDMGLGDRAFDLLSRALTLCPTSPAIRWNLSLSQLKRGDFDNGWTNHEARWAGCDQLRGGYALPAERAWRGEPLQGKRLLLWTEQGFGDTLQFIRFAQDLADRGAQVAVLAPPELAELLRSVPGVTRVHAQSHSTPDYDWHCPIMSLPLHLRIAPDPVRLRSDVPYLTPTPERCAHWQQRIGVHKGLRVGLVWAGSARAHSIELRAIDARRSIELARFRSLLTVPGCSFFSLQKGAPARELQSYAAGKDAAPGTATIHDFAEEWRDFSDTAAFIANLDLIISVDTAVAHLAGALGKPIWLLNRYDACWRWLEGRDDSPWYATLRQFRQQTLGDWEPVIANVAAALAEAAHRAAR